MRTFYPLLATLITATALLTACSSGSDGSTSSRDLVIVRGNDSTTMDNTMVHDNDSIWVFQQIFESLYEVTPDGQDVRPLLVDDHAVSDDQLTWTFTLKDGVTFSNGDPMTSEDVKFSIDAAGSTEGGWEFLNAAIASIEAPDPSTVVVTTKYPWAPLLADLANFSNAIVPADYGGKSKDDFYASPVGTGPFKWGHWDRGSELELTANETYWGGAPALSRVTWKVVPDDNARNLQLQGGQADINEAPPFASVDQLKGQKGFTVELFPSTRTDYILMNHSVAPFDDVFVRRAVSYAIDRESIIKTVLFGYGEVGNSLLMPTVPFYDPNTPGQQYDLDAARTELGKSSVPDGFSVTYLAKGGDAVDAGIAQILQASLAQIGITVNIENLDPSAVQEKQQTGDFELSHTYWTMDIADPDELVSFAVDPDTGGNSFFTRYSNPEVTADARAAAQELDEAERSRLYSEVQRQTAEDAFLPTIFYSPAIYAVSDAVTGFEVYPTGNFHLEDVSLNK